MSEQTQQPPTPASGSGGSASAPTPSGTPMQEAESAYEDILEQLTETDLQEGSKRLMRNLISKDLVLAYFKEEEVNEWKWKIRSKRKLFFDMHPSSECLVTGEDRAAINDDPSDTLSPLNEKQRMIAHDFFDMMETRPTRAREMRQQEMMNMSIRKNVAERSDPDEGGGGGLRDKIF